MLTAKQDQTLVILLRHYSGWCYARTLQPPFSEGWVPDSYIKPHGSKDSADLLPLIQRVKKFKVTRESLEKILEIAGHAERSVRFVLEQMAQVAKSGSTSGADNGVLNTPELHASLAEQLGAVIEHLTSEVTGICEALYGS